MRIEHREWLKKNMNQVNEVFELSSYNLKQEVNVYESFIDIFDSKEEFDFAWNGCLPCIDEEESTFDYLQGKGMADIIDGKFVYFNDVAFDYVIDDVEK